MSQHLTDAEVLQLEAEIDEINKDFNSIVLRIFALGSIIGAIIGFAFGLGIGAGWL